MTGLRLDLYKKTQDELMIYILNNYNCCIDDYGNLFSIKHKNKPVFVAHADTVIDYEYQYKSQLVIEDGKLSRPGCILGADDRAGVNLILNHSEKINWVITRDEEIGLLGANSLAKCDLFNKQMADAGFFIELDRRGANDILGNVHGYCEEGVVELLKTVLVDFKDTSGVFTDIDAFADIRQGVNLSVGYYDAHTKNEFLNIAEWSYIDSVMVDLGSLDCSDLKNTYTSKKHSFLFDESSPSAMTCSVCDGPIYANEVYAVIKSFNVNVCCMCYKEEIA